MPGPTLEARPALCGWFPLDSLSAPLLLRGMELRAIEAVTDRLAGVGLDRLVVDLHEQKFDNRSQPRLGDDEPHHR